MYDLKENHDRFIDAYTDLSHRLLVWPPISEMEREGLKHQWVRQLDQIAKVLNTPRPITLAVTEDSIPTEGKWVLKREFSANCEHVETVDLDNMTEAAIKSLGPIRRAVGDDDFKWIIQSYQPLLRQWGEWRVLLIGGRTRYIILTTKSREERRDGWDWNKVEYLYTLEELT